ncbi:MAG: DegT/DnrJ/EryC1/StrS family aminotransferase [Candidatus Sumerlaeaceae bacterium]
MIESSGALAAPSETKHTNDRETSLSKLALNGGTPVRTEPFPSWPIHGPEEENAVLEVVRSGKWWFGEKVAEFEKEFAAFQDAKHGITCCNGTIALELAMKALGIQAGDEVLVPAYTFIATATSVLQLRAVPIFIDIDPMTANMDLTAAEAAITPRTRAIIVVHFGGLPIDLDAAKALAKKHDLLLIEDAAHSWGSQWRGKGTGAHGDLGTFSFQMSKNLTSAEGGIIVTDNEEYGRLARSFVNVGRREDKPWYFHYIVSGNYRITEFQAALLLVGLSRLDEQNKRRTENALFLDAELGKVSGLTVRPTDPRVTRRAYHLYGFRYDGTAFGGLHRDKLLEALKAEGIPAFASYPHPVYRNPAIQELQNPKPADVRYWQPELPGHPGFTKVHCPNTERLCSDEALWFPHTMLLGNRADMQDVVDAMHKVRENLDELK